SRMNRHAANRRLDGSGDTASPVPKLANCATLQSSGQFLENFVHEFDDISITPRIVVIQVSGAPRRLSRARKRKQRCWEYTMSPRYTLSPRSGRSNSIATLLGSERVPSANLRF